MNFKKNSGPVERTTWLTETKKDVRKLKLTNIENTKYLKKFFFSFYYIPIPIPISRICTSTRKCIWYAWTENHHYHHVWLDNSGWVLAFSISSSIRLDSERVSSSLNHVLFSRLAVIQWFVRFSIFSLSFGWFQMSEALVHCILD